MEQGAVYGKGSQCDERYFSVTAPIQLFPGIHIDPGDADVHIRYGYKINHYQLAYQI